MTAFLLSLLLAPQSGKRRDISLPCAHQKQALTISVYPDLAVKVKAPNGKSLDQIKARVEHRAAWISKQCNIFAINPCCSEDDL